MDSAQIWVHIYTVSRQQGDDHQMASKIADEVVAKVKSL